MKAAVHESVSGDAVLLANVSTNAATNHEFQMNHGQKHVRTAHSATATAAGVANEFAIVDYFVVRSNNTAGATKNGAANAAVAAVLAEARVPRVRMDAIRPGRDGRDDGRDGSDWLSDRLGSNDASDRLGSNDASHNCARCVRPLPWRVDC